MYPMMKHSHLLFVVLTVFLFNLRFLLRWVWPEKNLPKLLKIMPHLNDTLLLGTGLWLMYITKFMPFVNADWLGVKLLLLVFYIGVGTITMKSAPRSGKNIIAYIASMLCVAAMVYLALYKSFDM